MYQNFDQNFLNLALEVFSSKIASVGKDTEMVQSNNNLNFQRFLAMQLSINDITRRGRVCRNGNKSFLCLLRFNVYLFRNRMQSFRTKRLKSKYKIFLFIKTISSLISNDQVYSNAITILKTFITSNHSTKNIDVHRLCFHSPSRISVTRILCIEFIVDFSLSIMNL